MLLRRLQRYLVNPSLRQLLEEWIAGRPVMHDVGVAEAGVERRGARRSLQRPVDGRDGKTAGPPPRGPAGGAFPPSGPRPRREGRTHPPACRAAPAPGARPPPPP